MNLPRLNLKRILVPVKLTAESCLALPEAVRLVKRYGGEIVLFHVVKLNIVGEERGIPRNELCEGMGREAEASLQRLADQFADTEVTIRVRVDSGDPRPLIVNVAEQIQADLIVMKGQPRKNCLRKWFSFNTGDYVLRHAHCPVWMLCADKQNGGIVILVDGNDTENLEPEPYANAHLQRNLLQV